MLAAVVVDDDGCGDYDGDCNCCDFAESVAPRA